MGAGPPALARAGAAERLRERGHRVRERLVEAPPWRAEIETAFAVQRAVAEEAAAARDAGEVPLLLSGNCNTTVGMLTAPGRRTGVVWFDAHGDFNTPETDATGFLDGHGLAMVAGRCWTALTAGVPGFAPVPERRIMLVGARSLDTAEETALRASPIAWLPPERARDLTGLRQALAVLAAEVDDVHVHVDLDVHDPSVAPANSYAAPDGMSAEEVLRAVREIAARMPVTSATLASYDPACDEHGRMADTAVTLLTELAGLGVLSRDVGRSGAGSGWLRHRTGRRQAHRK